MPYFNTFIYPAIIYSYSQKHNIPNWLLQVFLFTGRQKTCTRSTKWIEAIMCTNNHMKWMMSGEENKSICSFEVTQNNVNILRPNFCFNTTRNRYGVMMYVQWIVFTVYNNRKIQFQNRIIKFAFVLIEFGFTDNINAHIFERRHDYSA